MASTDFPENPAPQEEDTPAEKAADSQPSLQDYSSDDMWDLDRKLVVAGEHYDHRIENLNQKALADAHVRSLHYMDIQERMVALQERQLALRQDAQNFWAAQRERQDQHAVTISRAQDNVILSDRTVEPTREETIQDATAAAVNQAVDTVSRAMVDRTQTSAANATEGGMVLSQMAGIVNTMQTQSASTQAAFQALTNQVSQLVGAVQALTGNQPSGK